MSHENLALCVRPMNGYSDSHDTYRIAATRSVDAHYSPSFSITVIDLRIESCRPLN